MHNGNFCNSNEPPLIPVKLSMLTRGGFSPFSKSELFQMGKLLRGVVGSFAESTLARATSGVASTNRWH